MDPKPPDPAAAPAHGPDPRPSRRGGWFAGPLVASLLVIAALAAAVAWVLRTEAGTAWLLARLPGVVVTAPKGTLIGDLEAARIELPLDGGLLVLQGAGWRGLRVEAAPGLRWWLRLNLAELHAARIDLRLPPSGGAAATPPTELRLPLAIDIRALRVGALYVDKLGATPLRELAARVQLGDEAGAVHRIDGLQLGWARLQVRGSASLRSEAPLALSAALALAQDADASGLTWKATATLAGALAAPLLQATVRAEPLAPADATGPRQAPQSLTARAVLRPFAAWPLGELQAQVKSLDLSALHGSLPATALDGDASVSTSAFDQPADVVVQLANSAAGRWNDGRLPVRTLSLGLRARPDQPGTLELHTLDAALGTQQAAAGRLQGQGRWTHERWTLDAALQALQPALLDTRAAPMVISGPLHLSGDGSDTNTTVDVKAELAGQLAARGPARAVQLRLDASVNAQHIALREAQARAGGASASLAGDARRDGEAWWLKAQAALVDFDPLPWWPGRGDSPWRQGPHRLNAKGDLDLRVPAAVPASMMQALPALRGQARIEIAKSRLAGVPLAGELSLRSVDGRQALAKLVLELDGNRVKGEGRLDARAGGSDDQWDLSIDAPTLARLAPLARLVSADAALAGTASGQLQLTGRWPAIVTRGQADASALRIASARVERARLRWQLGTRAEAPVELQATLTQAAFGSQSLESAQLEVQGTGRTHRVELRARSTARPPAWVDTVQAAPAAPAGTPASASVARLSAQGGLVDGAAGAASGWRGRIDQLALGGDTDGGPDWLRTRDVALELQWGGAAPRLELQPGRAEVLGGVLRWSRIAWQAAVGTTPAQLDAQAVLEPLLVAPLLARIQPDFGWGGDLAISGRLDIHSAPSFSADIVIERQRGDLSVTDETGTQALGLSDLRLGLNATDGVWSFTQGLAGRTLGVAAGAVVARTSAQATWPSADTPIQGVLELQVANLGTWGTWVPAGWRLGGTLRTSATIGGRFAAPEYTGEVRGQALSVRNFLQGVNVSDGEVAIALQGASARIETFKARAGAGSVTLEGSASLGETPQALLTLVADRFQLLGRIDRRIVASGRGQLKLERDTLALDGEFGVDEGLIDFTRGDAPGLSDDVQVVRRKAGASAGEAATPARPAPSAAARKVALDLRVHLGERLRVRGRGLDTGLRGELRITSPGGALAVNGSVSTFEGSYAAYGQKLTIDRGQLAFSGPVENPRLDIEATRPNLDLRVGVQVSGGAQNPRVRLFSEPEVSEIDKLSYLVLGRASEGLGRTDTALLQRAAMALLAGEGEGLTDQLTKVIGLDELSLRQTEGEVRETVISLGKQLSRRWYVGYERGLNATAGTWQLIYRVARRFTLRAQSGLDNSLDLIWTWRWQ